MDNIVVPCFFLTHSDSDKMLSAVTFKIQRQSHSVQSPWHISDTMASLSPLPLTSRLV